MIHQLAKKIGLGLALTCGLSALALAQVPNVDTSKIDAAAKDAKQAKTAADETATTGKEGAATAKDTASSVQKKDVKGAQEGAAKPLGTVILSPNRLLVLAQNLSSDGGNP